MIVLWSALAILGGCLLFLGGFYTGVWIQRNSYQDREVPKVVTTEKVVVHNVPEYIQVPAVRPPQPASLPVMGSKRNHVIVDPTEREATQRVGELLDQLPEM